MTKATITTKILGDAFMGMSTLRWSSSSQKLVATQAWDKEVPVGKDTVSFLQGDPTINKYYIHGQAAPYASTAEPGDITMALEIPSIDEDTTGWLATQMANAPVAMEDEVDGVDGTWAPIGKGIKLDIKTIRGMAMLISQDKQYAIVIKNLKGFSSVMMDSISTKPVGFKVSCSLEGISDDTDGDVVFLKWTPIEA